MWASQGLQLQYIATLRIIDLNALRLVSSLILEVKLFHVKDAQNSKEFMPVLFLAFVISSKFSFLKLYGVCFILKILEIKFGFKLFRHLNTSVLIILDFFCV